MTLAECAQALASVEPFDGRMQPVTTPDGVAFLRDDFKAPWWTLDACFDFMRAAQATRKIIVIGELSDVSPAKGVAYARAAALAVELPEVGDALGRRAARRARRGAPVAGEVLHRDRRGARAGVVEQHVEPSAARESKGVERRLPLVAVAHVHHMARGCTLGQQRGGFVDPLSVDVGEANEPALRREVARCRAADARPAAGNENRLPCHPLSP